jgi:hypothetical protein
MSSVLFAFAQVSRARPQSELMAGLADGERGTLHVEVITQVTFDNKEIRFHVPENAVHVPP